MIVEKYVKGLPDDEKILIINGYEKFSKDGVIGDEPIRLHARALINQLGADDHMVVVWMNNLALECFRYFAHQWINDKTTTTGRPDSG